MKIKRLLKEIGWGLFIMVLLLGVPPLAGLIASQFYYGSLDPYGSFGWISVHHIVQALIFLLIMITIGKYTSIEFGFGWGDRRVGLLYVRLFTLFVFIYAFVTIIIIFITGSFPVFPYPLTLRNIVGQFGFQLLLSGPSEELIFRAFSISMLGVFIKGSFFQGRLTFANIIATIIFGLAHVSFSLFPFTFSYNPIQVFYAISLGLIYGVCYEKSKGMLYPMMMHSISNVVAVGISLVAFFLVR